MFCMIPRAVPALVLTLAAGAGPLAAAPTANLLSPQLAALKARQPVRAAQAQAHLLSIRPQVGLDSQSGFIARETFTNPQGRTVTRFNQTYQGLRVWGAEAIVHVEAQGAVRPVTQGLKAGISLSDAPRLSAEQATAIALRSLAAKGPMRHAPRVEQVVFPTRFTGGMATRMDPVHRREVLDLEMSITAKAPAAPYVWAYEVRTLLANREDGHREINFIVDASTGAILRKWNGLQGDTPATNIGNSSFRGQVNLSTAKAADGTFSLKALDRGTLANPWLAEQGLTEPGIATFVGAAYPDLGFVGLEPYAGNTTGTWGTGSSIPFPIWWGVAYLWDVLPDRSTTTWVLKGAMSPDGETNAVDAHYGVCTSWDFFKQVFGRDGIDGMGTSPFVVAHATQNTPYGPGAIPDNAYWSPWTFSMNFGDGAYIPEVNAATGVVNLTELDVAAHELSHGVMAYTGGFIYSGLSGGLNEGNSDFLAKMVQAYVEGGNQGDTIPDFPAGDLTKWEFGRNCVAPGYRPLRYLYKPSLDLISADANYDGLQEMDVHFSSGVFNRAMFFLTSGASSQPASPTHSLYLPQGMTGIGNDKAARIWWKALTEYLTPDADFTTAREGCIRAARDLYGEGGAEERAVWKAWAAVNVGISAPGEAPRPWVSWPLTNPEGSYVDHALNGAFFRRLQFVPTHAKVKLKVDVAHTTNKAVTFAMGRPWETFQAGNISPDGTWPTPLENYWNETIIIKATSQADPAQFAVGKAILVHIDANLDNELDAFDLGDVAMSWGLDYDHLPKPTTNIAGSLSGVNDYSLLVFNQAFAYAFRVE